MSDPDLRLLTYLERGEEETDVLTSERLDARARSLAVHLRSLVPAGDRALLFFGPGLAFSLAYWGCVYSGLVAVPLPSPGVRAIESASRLAAVRGDCDATVLLTTSELVPQVRDMAERDPRLADLHLVAVDSIGEALAGEWEPPDIGADSLVHLQYSSGSTGTPKGVLLTHENVLANLRMVRGDTPREDDRGVTWLPMFHDMGLVLGAFLPVYGGGPAWVMSPLAFLQQPVRWLRAIDAVQATLSAAPNFALDLAVERVGPEERELLDLSSLDVLSIGSEPVRRDSLRRFAEAFEPCGFDPAAFFPSYGLAEATLMVSGGPLGSGVKELHVDAAALAENRARPVDPADPSARALVACGAAADGVDMAIVDPDTREPLEDGLVGEIVLASPGVASGYWNRSAESAETFGVEVPGRGGGFMRTGDVGFVLDAQLYVTGRRKELVIVHGQNHYPQDIEMTAHQSHVALRKDRCVAFAVDDGERERVVVVGELDRRALHRAGGKDRDLRPEIVEAIRGAVAARHGIQVDEVRLVRRVPLTSSGKLRRTTCRDMFVSGTFDVRAEAAAA